MTKTIDIPGQWRDKARRPQLCWTNPRKLARIKDASRLIGPENRYHLFSIPWNTPRMLKPTGGANKHSSLLENFEMRHSHRQKYQGFTLVELLVVIAIIGTLVGLLLPAVQAAREAARSNTCRNNLTQLQKAITQRETRMGDFPGYINMLGIKGTSRQIRASWVVTTFPDIEQTALWDRWNQDSVVSGSSLDPQALPQLEILICPSDPPTTAGAPLLSYVANSGWIQRTNGNLSSLSIPSGSPFTKGWENPANGVFLDKTRRILVPDVADSHIGPVDEMDDLGVEMQSVTTAYIQAKGDGTSATMLLSESRRATTWTYPSIEVNDYAPTGGTTDEKYHFGYCWEQPEAIADALGPGGGVKQYFRMNAPLPPEVTPAQDYNNYAAPRDMQMVDGFANSNHPGGVNVAFVGGAVQYMGDSIEPRVYAQLMTTNRNQSDLHVGTRFEKDLAPLSEGEY
jgi:prepilin-type N-terminal cleavage/methylation domain-containing protein/prepilin-type processing-associated H-X9-DG protein